MSPDLEIHPDRRDYIPDPADPVAPLTTAGTVAGALVERARRQPDKVAFYLPDDPEADQRITAAGLLERAHAAGATLAAAGLGPGGRVALCLDTSAPLLAALFGAALLGAVPSILEPPLTGNRKQLWLDRVRHIVAVARPAVLVCDEALRAPATEALDDLDVTVISPPFRPGRVDDPVLVAEPEEAALIQFSSGTTDAAKGVVLSHRSLLAAASALAFGAQYLANDVILSWVPLYHDMGLVGATIGPFLLSMTSVLLPPMAFGARPDRWLRVIHRYRATLSPAPNFAYRLVASLARRVDLTGLDLSCWRSAYNGAEVVEAATLRDFYQATAPFGMRPENLRPCYGMAELGLCATVSRVGAPPRVEVLSRSVMAETGKAVPPLSDEDAGSFVSSGVPVPGTKIRIVDDGGVDRPDGHAGRVLIASESMMSGYLLAGPHRPDLQLLDGWLDTGDLGFLLDGELFVTGRHKDLIILAGRNYQPQSFERAAESVDGVRMGAVSAVGVLDPDSGTERLVIVAESPHHRNVERAATMMRAIEQTVADHTGVRPAQVLVVAPRTLPKTSSGKLQRAQVTAMLAAGTVG